MMLIKDLVCYIYFIVKLSYLFFVKENYCNFKDCFYFFYEVCLKF